MTAQTTMRSEPDTHQTSGTKRRSPSEPSDRDAGELTVEQIIARARVVPGSSRGAWVLAASTAVLTWASFTPLDFGPLGWICLVPLVLLIRLKQRTRWMYTAVYVCGLLTALATLQWMRLGDPTMYIAWAVLAIYLGLGALGWSAAKASPKKSCAYQRGASGASAIWRAMA